jgi:hypothetical protein
MTYSHPRTPGTEEGRMSGKALQTLSFFLLVFLILYVGGRGV